MRLWCLLAALMLLCSTGCSPAVDEQALVSWGLPGDLPEHLDHVELLELPPAVDRLGWLPDHLKALDLAASRASDLSDLPDDLRELDARRASGITALEELPSGLHTLDIRWSGVEDLGTLGKRSDSRASGLRVLRAGGAGLEHLGELPGGLTTLELVDVPFEDGSILPKGLRELHLAGHGVVGLRSLPSRLTVLSLDRVSSRDLLDLPPSVTSLHLQAVEVTLDHLPQFLTELSWTVPKTKIIGPLPRSLRRLRLIALGEQPITARQVPELPRGLEHLEVSSAAGDLFAETELPPNLRALALPGFRGESLAFDLPDSLEELSLAYSDLQVLPDLPKSLRALDLSGASNAVLNQLAAHGLPERLERLVLQGLPGAVPFGLPDSIRCLDLSGSPDLRQLPDLPKLLEHLDLRSTGVTAFPALPGSLRSIALGGTAVASLAGLPETIEEVVVDAGQLHTLDGLPRSVRILRFEESRDRAGARAMR